MGRCRLAVVALSSGLILIVALVGAWRIFLYRPVRAVLRDGGARITSVAISPDGQVVASVDGDGRLRFWDVRTATETGVLTLLFRNYGKAVFSPDGALLAVGALE